MTKPKPSHVEATLRVVKDSSDPDKLRRLMHRAEEMGVREVKAAAFEKLISILPQEEPGTFEYDFWRSILVLEELLRQERGKTVRLSRTRQKISRVGIKKVLEDFAMHPSSTDGYDKLMEIGRPDLTGEAVVLRHASSFDYHVVEAARSRLGASGVNIDDLK